MDRIISLTFCSLFMYLFLRIPGVSYGRFIAVVFGFDL